MEEGNVLPDDQTAPWTPAFFLGLRMSKALIKQVQGGMRSWFIYPAGERQWLERDLKKMSPVFGRLSKRYRFKHMRERVLSRCPAASVPCSEPESLGVVVGILAGARWLEISGYRWLAVPKACSEVLVAWGLPVGDYGQQVTLSPFWGALMAHLMPPTLREGFLVMERDFAALEKGVCGWVGGCPLLPSVFWAMAMSDEFGSWMTFRGELPFGKPWGWYRHDEDLTVGELPGKGLEMGMTRVRPEIRELLVRWRGLAMEARGPSSVQAPGEGIPPLQEGSGD